MERVRGASVRVGKSPHGLGLQAAEDIPAGAVVLIFTGELLELDDVLASGRDECYPLQVGPSTYLDLDARSRIVNHSCSPNAGIRSDRILVSLREIRSGEEICYDYSTTMSERRWTMECACRAANCRALVGDFHELPMGLQRDYLRLGVVQSFIVAELWFDEIKAGSWGRRREENVRPTGDRS